MLLRSSSTPILGSLLSSYSDSPNHHNHHHNHHNNHHNHHHNHHNNHHNHHSSDFNPSKQQPPIKLSLHQTTPPNLFTPSPSTHNPNSSHTETGTFRRVQSEGNLNELLSDSFNTSEVLNPHHLITNKLSSNPHCSVSEHGTPRYDDEEEESGEVMSTGGFGGGGGRRGATTGGGAGDGADVEEYYQRMMQEYPGNALFLSNYAQFLHQSKDLAKAEEYYSRATLIDPGEAEILSKYAQLTWELHRDQERTSIHFHRAIQAAPQDCHVLAAYAGFLWETDEEEADNDMVCAIAPSYRCRGEFQTDKYDADSVF